MKRKLRSLIFKKKLIIESSSRVEYLSTVLAHREDGGREELSQRYEFFFLPYQGLLFK